jgi:hypothetical protein
MVSQSADATCRAAQNLWNDPRRRGTVSVMRRSGWVVVLGVLLGAPSQLFAESRLLASKSPTPFDRGSFAIEVAGGTQNALGYRYFGLGAGVDYYVVDGVAVGIFALHEFGDGPSLNQVRPSLTYVAQPLVGSWPVIPYVGGLYKHWFVGAPYEDLDSVGARTGVLYLNGRVILGVGAVLEQVVSTCRVDCTQVYPDLNIGFTF